MSEAEDTSFARLVSLACHDLRTPLATVHGFVRTLRRLEDRGEPEARYLAMMDAASEQMAQLLDDLGLVARIESGRFEPTVADGDTLELARQVAVDVGPDAVAVSGDGGPFTTEPAAVRRALASLARCLLRHGGLERVALSAVGPHVTLTPVPPSVAPILLADELRDFGAAVAGRVIAALGGSLEVDGEALQVRLPVAVPH
jgi:signal transduction histidine kinase